MHEILVTLGALTFGYLSFLLGDSILVFFETLPRNNLRRFAFGTALGYGAFGLISLVLSLGGFFKAPVLYLVFLLILVWNFRIVSEHFRFILKTFGAPGKILFAVKTFWRRNNFLGVLAIIWVLANLIVVFVPLTGHDTLDYHLPIINSFVSGGRFDFGSLIEPFRYLPALGELIYANTITAFYNFTDPRIFQVVQYSVVFLLLIMMYEFLRPRLSNRLFALVLPLLILSVMDFSRELLHGGYVDVFAFLFGLASTILVIEHADEKRLDLKKIGLSAIFLGLALSVKYTGLFFGIINGVILLVYFFLNSVQFRKIAATVAIYCLPVLVIAGFWYGKNLVSFGNPVYPMFSDARFTGEISYFISERTLPNFIAFPFWRYGQWFVQAVETSSRLIVLGYFVVMYAFLIYFLLARRRLTRSRRAPHVSAGLEANGEGGRGNSPVFPRGGEQASPLGETLRTAGSQSEDTTGVSPWGFTFTELSIFLFIEIYLGFLFFSSHQYRFLLPAVLMAPALLVLFADHFYTFLREKYGEVVFDKLMKITSVSFCLLFSLIFLGNLHYFSVKWNYILGNYTEKEYIIRIGGQ